MDAESASGIELRIETTRSVAGTDAPAPLISDSFNPRPKPMAAAGAHSGGDDCLARGSLPEPFAHIAIAAYLVGEDDIRRAEALESNLIKWGVSLLAVVIIVSSVILILLTVRQATLARRRSEFVVGMSHDLRTPVAAMQILADSLCAGRVSSAEKRQEFLCSIASECSRLADMIERVLFFFRQEHGAMTYTIQECNLDDIIQSAVKSVAVRLPADFSLGVDLGDTGEHFVKADAGALAKVLVNLLDNAIKYGQSPGGGRSSIDVRVSVKRHLLRDWVVISVVDHGCGIEPREHRKIFRRFYRVGSEGSHIGGIGLGLFLCYDIVRVHGGRIRVLSRPGCGAEFQVWLKRYGRKNSER
jgi:signal transduction histidine kinase